jgi:hypothetical protein
MVVKKITLNFTMLYNLFSINVVLPAATAPTIKENVFISSIHFKNKSTTTRQSQFRRQLAYRLTYKVFWHLMAGKYQPVSQI